MANRPVSKPVFESPQHWTDYVPGTPEQLEIAGDVSLVVGVAIIVVVAPEITPVLRIPPIRVPIPRPAL